MSALADRDRSKLRLWAAPGGSHDRIVKLLRVVLPVAIGVLIVLLGLAPVTQGRDISFMLAKDSVEVARERMRVTRAEYRGEDSRGQPFTIVAGSAVQATSRDPVVQLQQLSARIALTDGPAEIRAKTGRYDMSSERVYVDGKVDFTGPAGYELQTRDVAVDLTTRQVASNAPVDGRIPLGNFSANRLRANLNDRTVVLDGRARLHIVQRGATGAQ